MRPRAISGSTMSQVAPSTPNTRTRCPVRRAARRSTPVAARCGSASPTGRTRVSTRTMPQPPRPPARRTATAAPPAPGPRSARASSARDHERRRDQSQRAQRADHVARERVVALTEEARPRAPRRARPTGTNGRNGGGTRRTRRCRAPRQRQKGHREVECEEDRPARSASPPRGGAGCAARRTRSPEARSRARRAARRSEAHRLHVEPEDDAVPVLHAVLLALQPVLPALLGRVPRTALAEHLERNDLRPDESARDVGVDLPGGRRPRPNRAEASTPCTRPRRT